MFAYAQHKHRSAERFGDEGRERRHARAFYVRRRRDTQLRRRKRHAPDQDCSTIFRRASKPLTKSGLESPFLMLPGTSYDSVCVRVRRVHKRLRRAATAKKNVSSSIVCFRQDSA